MEDASVGPGNPDHIPSGLCRGIGSSIELGSSGPKGVGVTVACGLGVARGPSQGAGEEQLVSISMRERQIIR
jgi:hypothetical protein